jgi:D-alanyl-lipoteichoic acid acyltransferase DltB (MBOAT superfamily)
MYIPLGGARWRAANVWPIFSFVALWHDLEWRLLGWAWIMALFMAPEMVAKWAGRQAWCIADKGSARFKHLCAAAAAANILVLMSANLVGFVVGVDGLLPLLNAVLGEPAFAAGMLCVFFCAAHVMFAIREAEQKAEVRARLKAASLNGDVEHEKGV